MVSQTRGKADPLSVINTGLVFSNMSWEGELGVWVGVGGLLGGWTISEVASAVSVLIVI